MGVPKGLTAEKKLITDEILSAIFADFPILNAESARKRLNFAASYLHNRLELRGKWAHFEK